MGKRPTRKDVGRFMASTLGPVSRRCDTDVALTIVLVSWLSSDSRLEMQMHNGRRWGTQSKRHVRYSSRLLFIYAEFALAVKRHTTDETMRADNGRTGRTCGHAMLVAHRDRAFNDSIEDELDTRRTLTTERDASSAYYESLITGAARCGRTFARSHSLSSPREYYYCFFFCIFFVSFEALRVGQTFY